MFGDTTLNCWSISDRARKLGNEINRWNFSWRAVITVWIVRNRCKFPEKVQLVSLTSYLLRYFRNTANVKSNARFAELRQNLNFYVAWNLFHITPMLFSLKTFGKMIKAKAVAVHANWQISCTSSKPQQPKLCHRRTDSIFESARHTFSHSPIKMLISKQKFAISKWRRSKASSQIKSPV